jgi:N-acylneuraminate cytidylyltransferase
VALVPVRGNIRDLDGRPILKYTIDRARESKYIKKVIVSADSENAAGSAVAMGAEAPFVRDGALSADNVNIVRVLQYSLNKIEESGIFPDLVVSLEMTFPFRPKGFLDRMIEHLVRGGFDSVVGARLENKAIWKERDGDIVQLDEGITPRQFKRPTFIELRGLGCVTHPEFLRQGQLFGQKIGIYEVSDPYSHLEVRSDEDFMMASRLIEGWDR